MCKVTRCGGGAAELELGPWLAESSEKNKKKQTVDVFSGKTKNHRLSKSKRLEVNGGSAAVFCCHMLTRCSHDCFGSNDEEISQGD